MTDKLIVLEREGEVAQVILNRPEKRNAMNLPMMEQLDAAFDEIERMDGLRVVILRGEGKGFSAGIDLMGFMSGELNHRFGDHWRDNLFTLTALYQGILNKVEQCTYPVIGLLHNVCLGMGCELALACDFRVVTEGTRIGLPETRVGLIPDVGGTTRLTRLIGVARAKEYIMTGKEFNLTDAERWGLVNYVVPEGDLMAKGQELTEELCAAAPLAVSYAKKVIDGTHDIQRGLQMEAWAQSILIRTDDVMVGAQAMLSKQKPDWQGK